MKESIWLKSKGYVGVKAVLPRDPHEACSAVVEEIREDAAAQFSEPPTLKEFAQEIADLSTGELMYVKADV